jgi:hypothetical protein
VSDVLTFYNHRGVRITDQWVAIDGRRYPVRELSGVRTTRGPISRIAVRALGAGGSMFAVAVLLGPVLPVLMTAALGLAGIVAMGIAYLASRIHPREQVLWIDVRGAEYRLIATRDSIEIGKVSRALRRALERDARFLSHQRLATQLVS